MQLIKRCIRRNSNFKPFSEYVLESVSSAEPSELLISKYLESNDRPQTISLPTEKSLDFKLSRSQYQTDQNIQPKGNIVKHKLHGLNITFAQFNFGWSIHVPSLYKFLQQQNPDLILMQLRPDKILSNFRMIKKSSADIFSNSLYWKQNCRKGYEVMPSNSNRQKILEKLKKSTIRLNPLRQGYADQYGKLTKIPIRPIHNMEALNDDLVATVSLYSQRTEKPIGLAHLPQISQRQWIANSHTLMELQLILRQSSQQIPMYMEGTSPRRIAQFLFPQLILQYSDKYMATLLEYLAALNKYRHIVMFVGTLQSNSVLKYLQHRSVSNLLADMLPPKAKGSVIRDVQALQILQKHCIQDVLLYGEDILKMPIGSLTTTNKIAQFYVKGVQGLPVDHRIFMSDCYRKYVGILKEATQEGQRLKKKEFIRRVV